MSLELEHWIEWEPAYDRRSEGYGVHGVTMRWFARGPLGAIQFVVYTNWMISDIGRPKLGLHEALFCKPMAADLGYHSHHPMYDGQAVQSSDCPVLDGPCYYDGSTLHAEPVLDLLIREGGDAVWALIDREYVVRLGHES